jgi:hypothetical protein
MELIRSVIVIKFKPGTTIDRVRELIRAMDCLRVDGMLSLRSGIDLGLREGNWDYALTADFADHDAYRRYDQDVEHNRIRRELSAAITESAVRVQFDVSA